MAAATDPAIARWRDAIASLGSQLVDLEADLTVARARTGALVGTSAHAWAEADAGIERAWSTYRAVSDLVEQAEAEPDRAKELLTTALATPAGPIDPTTAMRTARADLDAALALVTRLALAWDEPAERAETARRAAEAAADHATARAARALADLVATDPLAVQPGDLAVVEAGAAAAAQRAGAARSATARLDLDLADAHATLTALGTDVQDATGELAHAASRIAGLPAVEPVGDLAALAAWLERITAAATTNPTQAAAELDDWSAAAALRRDELTAALAPARDGMRRREEGRGLWSGLRAKAAARRVDEQPAVAAALAAARTALWEAPCDLAAADAALAELAAALEPGR